MEFVGWGVKKEFPEGGRVLGMVLEFEADSRSFKIAYENGETEKLDWSGLSSILVESSPGLPSGLLEDNSGCIRGKGNSDSVGAGVLVETSGRFRPFGINLNNGLCLDGDGSNGVKVVGSGVKFIGLDLNRGTSMDLDEGLSLSKGETGACLDVEEERIDLNMDASKCKGDGNAPGFDLNLLLPEDALRNMDGSVENLDANLMDSERYNAEGICKDELGRDLMSEDEDTKNSEVNQKIDDENYTPIDCEILTPISMLEKENGANVAYSSGENVEVAAPELLKGEFDSRGTKLELENKKDRTDGEFDNELLGHVPKGRRGRKRKKLERDTSVATSATGLRRSSRRAKIAALYATSEASSEIELVNPGNQAFSPAVSDISDELVTGTVCEESPGYDVVPPKVELPSSCCLDLDGSLVFDVFYVYSFLRSFSNLLFLSPFELKAFVASIKCNESTLLFDSIHLSLLRALKKHLETLSDEGLASASDCFRSLNWDFLDLITWPMFLLQYVLLHSTWYTPGCSLSQLNLFDDDYYQLPASTKLEILRHICDDVSEGEAFRSDINRRELEMEQLNDLERLTRYGSSRKRKAAMEFASSPCVTEENLIEAADMNADDCHLCKMDGNLICCDGCPAAFHSRCVGVASSLLPEGLWYCPECVIEKDSNEWLTEKSTPSIRVGNSIRAEVLGRDRCGRLYQAICGYLIVLESLSGDYSTNHYTIRLYSKDDLPKLFEFMDSSPFIYDKIKCLICRRWNVSYGDGGMTNDIETASHSIQSSFSQKETSAINPLHSETVEPEIQNDCPRIMPTVMKDESSHIHGGGNYVNYYEFARTAFSCFGELASLLSDKSSYDNPLSAGEILSKQLKIVTNRFIEFSWSNGHFSNSSTREERCGWCFYCRAPESGRDCLFILKKNAPSLEDSTLQASGIQDRNGRDTQLFNVMCYVLCLEGYLHGLLLGPWLSPHYSTIWCQSLLEDGVSSLKNMLLKLESNLHHLALSAEWNKHMDSQAIMGSACHVVSSLVRASSRNGNGRKRAKSSDAGICHPSSNTATGLSLFWWRGGRGSRILFSWKVLPCSLARKAARQGGGKKIPGILYPEYGEYAKRTKRISWRAAVETSRRVDQLALQVRELDANIRWNDICNNNLLLMTDGDSKKSFKSFKKVIIRRKFTEGMSSKYLLDFGKRRALPDVVTKFGSLVDDSKSLKKKYWLEESHVPLYLIKGFEEKRISRKTFKSNHDDPSFPKKPRERKGFEYLFSKLEASDLPACGHCHKDVSNGKKSPASSAKEHSTEDMRANHLEHPLLTVNISAVNVRSCYQKWRRVDPQYLRLRICPNAQSQSICEKLREGEGKSKI